MDLGLGGRGYLVTGASRGLGFAVAQALVVDGARVLVSSRSADAVDAAVAHLGGPPAAHGLAADLTDADAADRLVEAARSRLGRVDGLLVSVGGPEPGTVLDTAEWADYSRAYGGCVNGHQWLTEDAHRLHADGGRYQETPTISGQARAPFGDPSRGYIACPDCGKALRFTV